MSSFRRFEDIEAWKLARTLTNHIYDVTSKSDFSRDFGLRDQIRRASISIVSNIAEGFERDGDKEFLQFLYIAKGSCGEVRAQLYLAHDRNYLVEVEFNELLQEALQLSRVLAGLIKYLHQSQITGTKYKIASRT
jgi:four helix bundle protein